MGLIHPYSEGQDYQHNTPAEDPEYMEEYGRKFAVLDWGTEDPTQPAAEDEEEVETPALEQPKKAATPEKTKEQDPEVYDLTVTPHQQEKKHKKSKHAKEEYEPEYDDEYD